MPPLTPGELKVMRLLWEHGEMKPADLQGRFPEPIKNPALRFYLTTLVEKGHVTCPEGREGVLLQAGDATALGVPFDAWGIRRRLLRRLDPDPGPEHHQGGEAQRGRPPQAEATRRPSPDAKPRGSRSRK